MTNHITQSPKWKLTIALLAVTLVVVLVVGVVCGMSQFAKGDEVDLTSIAATLDVSTVYDDYDVNTIRKDLTVVGTREDGSTAPITDYTVTFNVDGSDADKLAVGATNKIVVTYNDYEDVISVEEVVAAEVTLSVAATENYTAQGSYFVDGDGYYAFVQGMTADQVASRLALVRTSPNKTVYYPVGANVTWTNLDVDLGDVTNTNDLVITIDLAYSDVDGIDDGTFSGNVTFAPSKRVGLKLSEDWTQNFEVTPATSAGSFINSLLGYVFAVRNSGIVETVAIDPDDFNYTNVVVGTTAEALLNPSLTEFDKVIEIPYKEAGISALKLPLTVKNSSNYQIDTFNGIQGNLPRQAARSETLDFGDIYIAVAFKNEYNQSVPTPLYLKDLPETSLNVTFYNSSDQKVKVISKSVSRIEITCTIGSAEVTGTFIYNINFQVDTITRPRPTLQDTEITYSDAGCYTYIDGLLLSATDFPDDVMEVETPDHVTFDPDTNKLTFARGGSYDILVKFKMGENSDYSWDTVGATGDTFTDATNRVVKLKVNVLKAPITVALNGFQSEIQYGENEPLYTVHGEVDGSATMQFTATGANKVQSLTLPSSSTDPFDPVLDVEDKTTDAPSFLLYYTGTLAVADENGNTDYISYNFPTERGSYTAHVVTAETSWYDAGKTEKEFSIVQRQIVLSNASIAPVTFQKGVSYGTSDIVNQVTATGFAPQHQSAPGDVVTIAFASGASSLLTDGKAYHANNYAVTVTIHNSNYKWSDTSAASKTTTFTINKATLSFTASQSGFTYGDVKPDDVKDDTGLNGWASIATPTYTKDGSAFTVPSNGVWPAGDYVATYGIDSYVDGVLASDVNANLKVASNFTVAKKSINRVSVDLTNDNATYKAAAYYFAINVWNDGDTDNDGVIELPNKATYTYSSILNVVTSGILLTDGTTAITTIGFDGSKGVISVTDAGTYTFEISISDSNFTWTGDAKVTATATIKQQELALVLSQLSFDYDGTNHVPTVSATNADLTGKTISFTESYLSDPSGSAATIAKTEIIAAGEYAICVDGFAIADLVSGATYTYAVNYVLPTDNVLEFTITTPYLAIPTFKDGNNTYTVTYQGKNNPYTLIDYFASDYVLTVGTEKRSKLVFEVNGETVTALALADTYTLSVTPTGNYRWNDGNGNDGGNDPVTLTFTIKQLKVTVTWDNLDKTYLDSATTTATVTQCDGDEPVTVEFAYKQGATEVVDITNAPAGEYTVCAKSLSNDNYTLGDEGQNHEYTITKKVLSLPDQPTLSAVTFSNSGTSATINNFDGSLDGLISASITGVRPASFYTTTPTDADRIINTSDVSKYSFDVSTGIYKVYDAGNYIVTFTVSDTDNYCLAGNDAEKDFTESIAAAYELIWINFLHVNQQTLTAPALGANRAMEWNSVADLSNEVFTGTTDEGIRYSVMYGNASTTSATQSDVDGSDTTAIRGQYYVLLTVTDDVNKLNYKWIVNPDDGNGGFAGSTFVDKINGVPYAVYCTTDNGAQVRLNYAITASQVHMTLTAIKPTFTFGENGAYIGDTANIGRIGILNIIAYSAPAGYDDATWTGDGSVVYNFYKLTKEGRGDKLADADLVNGLPWNVGEYEVEVVITFDTIEGEEVYSQWKDSVTFEVTSRTLEVVWAFEGQEYADGKASTIYNGEARYATVSVTNMPSKDNLNDTSKPNLAYNYDATDANGPIDASATAYTFKVVGTYDNFNIDVTAGFDLTINKYNVAISAENVNNHVYGEQITGVGTWKPDDEKITFFGNDGKNINLVVLGNDGNLKTAVNTPVGTYILCPVWNNETLINWDDKTNKTYTIETTNYTITVTAADFVIVQREITVTFTENGASSVYGKAVNLYQLAVDGHGMYSYEVTNGGANTDVLVDGDVVTKAFTLTAYLDNVAVTGDGTSWNAGTYVVRGANVTNGNYLVKFVGEGTYVIDNANIKITKVQGYVGVYDGNDHDMFTALEATAENNEDVSWFYQDVNATDKTVWNSYDVSIHAKVKNVLDSGKYLIKATAANHNDVIYNTDGTNNVVAVTINKATINVQINLSIWYGEKDPANYNGLGVAFKATKDDLTDVDMYKFAGLVGGEAIDSIGVSGTFRYVTTYVQGNGAGTYDITFVIDETDPLSAPNYKFESATGVLTVNKLALTVTVDHIKTAYNTPWATSLFDGHVTIGLPNSTYTGTQLDITDLSANVAGDLTAKDGYVGASIFTLTTAAYTANNSSGITYGVGTYVISGAVKDAAKDNYSITLDGARTHEIVAAKLTVNTDIKGYYGEYDKKDHYAIVDNDGNVIALSDFATASDGTAITVTFHAQALESGNPVQATATEWAAWTTAGLVLTDNPQYSNVCRMAVYFRIEAGDNYEVVYDCKVVEITKKSITINASRIDDLIYGDDAPEFYYYTVDGGLESPEDMLELLKVDGTLPALFTSSYQAGNYAGKYNIVTLDESEITIPELDNYVIEYDNIKGLDKGLVVGKRTVTITIDDKQNTYNLNKGTEDASELTFKVTSDLSFYEFSKQTVYTNTNQSAIILKTVALKGTDGILTNNVIVVERNGSTFTMGAYPIYAVYGTYEDGSSYSINYDIKFSGCNYKDDVASDMLLDSSDEPITGSGSYAGKFTINQAILTISYEGLFYTNDDGQEVENKTGFYSGKAHQVKAVVPSDSTLKVEFIYQVLENGDYRNLNENEQVLNVGTYRAIGVCSSDNYFASEANFPINILRATLVLQAQDTTIQYGTKLVCTPNITRAENVVYDASSRFGGFSFKVITTDDEATKQLQASVIAKYLQDHEVSYTSHEYTTRTAVGQQCYITPVCASDSNISVDCVNGDLSVIKRQVVVTLKGYFNGNTLAQCDYLGLQSATQAKLDEAYTKHLASFIEVDDMGDSGDELSALNITFALPSNAINANSAGYGMTVSSGNSNYDVKFKTSKGNVDEVLSGDDDAPRFVINKAKLTIYAHNTVLDKVPNTYSVIYGNTVTYSYFVDGMQNGENFVGLIRDAGIADSDITYTVKYGDKAFAPWSSNVGETYTVSVNPFTFTLTNYELEKGDGKSTYVDTTLSITPRPITVSTENQVFEWDGSNYHGGAYGKSHEAVLTFSDNELPNDATIKQYLKETYKPQVATLTYDTLANAGLNQAAGAAPTTVGEYHVTARLTGSNYVFDMNGVRDDNVTLNFNVTKCEISEGNMRWSKTSIRFVEGEEIDGYNVIENYINAIMDIRLFTYVAYGQSGSQDINYGSSATPNTYYFVGQALAINANGRGRYEVQIQLKDTATANYVFKSSNGIRIVSSFTVTSSTIEMTLSIEDWVYNTTPNAPVATINGESNSGVRFTYAIVTDITNINNFYGQGALNSISNLPIGVFGDITTMTFNAAYYVVLAEYEGTVIGEDGTEETQGARLYYVFKVTPAKVALPLADTSDYVFNGQEQGLVIEYDALLVRASYNGHTGTNDKGIVVYATNAGTYQVTFALSDSNNYEWITDTIDGIVIKDNVVTLSWTIAKDDTANDDTILSMSEDNEATYGSVSLANPTIAQGYDSGDITAYWAKDEGQGAGAVTTWNTGLPVNAGDYIIRLRLRDHGNNFADKNIYVKLHVNKLEVTVTASGTVTYGNDWQTRGTLTYTVSQLAYGSHRVTGTAAYELADNYGKLNVNGDYYVLVASENGVALNLKVMDNGTDVSDNYTLTVAQGRLTVTPRPVTVTLGTATSQYGRPIDISKVTATYGQGQLIDGDDLNLTLATTALRADGEHSVVGGYRITATYNNANYNATIIAGTYTITERRITIELSNDGGGEYGNVKPVTYGKVFDDNNDDITSFVNGKLTLSIVYTGIGNNGQVYSGSQMPTYAGTYIATVQGSGSGNFLIVGDPYIQFVIDKKQLDESKIVIASQTYTGSALEPVIDKTAFVAAYGDNLYDQLAHGEFVIAGTHTVTLRLKDQYNYKWTSVDVAERDFTFVIDKANNELTSAIAIKGWIYGEYDVEANLPAATVKFGQEYIVFTYCNTVDGVYHSGAPTTGDVGEYYVRVTVPASDNFNAFESAPVKFAIAKKALAKPTLTLVTDGEGKNDVYTGSELLSVINGFDWSLMDLSYEGKFNVIGGNVVLVAINAGTYTVNVSIRNTNNYCFADTDDNTISRTWTVAPKAIAKPTENKSLFMVNGQVLTYIPEGFDEEIMTIEGNQTAYGGKFSVKVGLKDTANYVWEDGGTDAFELIWNVVGTNTVFYIVVGVLSGVSVIALCAAGIQMLLDKRRKRVIDRAIDERSQAEEESAAATTNTDDNDQGGNE